MPLSAPFEYKLAAILASFSCCNADFGCMVVYDLYSLPPETNYQSTGNRCEESDWWKLKHNSRWQKKAKLGHARTTVVDMHYSGGILCILWWISTTVVGCYHGCVVFLSTVMDKHYCGGLWCLMCWVIIIFDVVVF